MIKKTPNILGAILIIALTGFITFQPVSYSQEESTCPDFVKSNIQLVKTEFYENLSKLVSDSTSSTQNLALVFESYRDYLGQLSELFQDNSPNLAQSENVLTTPQAAKCQEYIQTEKTIVQTTMQNLLEASIRGKQSFNIIEKYSQINTQFSDLKLETDQVTKKIKTFSQQLPCYSQACVQN
jgi:hypothetical protein